MNDESLTGEELHMLRNLLGFKDVRVEDVMPARRLLPLIKNFIGGFGGLFSSPVIRACRFIISRWIIR